MNPATKHLNGVYESPTAYFLMVAGILKLHRAVAINMAPTSTFAMKGEDFQKAKEWGGSSHQSHGFNPSHIT